MRKADLTTRAIAGFVDLLLVIGLARLPDVIGFLAAVGYILVRDGLFLSQSIGKKVIGLTVAPADDAGKTISYRESIIRNVPLALAFLLFLVPYAGWVLGPLALAVEALTALGDERGMRIGDLLARTCTVPTAAVPEPEAPPAPVGTAEREAAAGPPESSAGAPPLSGPDAAPDHP
jgi:uncharacterized RDD family membrane protein YckC